ncbi:MAG: hypothetical protein KC561_07645, partial [Myxococcales bacterium]|nr:hypothetical protein [Myxococcales bacterium]
MKKETAMVAIIFVGLAAFFGGYVISGSAPEATDDSRPNAVGSAGNYDSSILPVGESPVVGQNQAPATVIMFADM